LGSPKHRKKINRLAIILVAVIFSHALFGLPQDIAGGASSLVGQDIIGGASIIFKRPHAFAIWRAGPLP